VFHLGNEPKVVRLQRPHLPPQRLHLLGGRSFRFQLLRPYLQRGYRCFGIQGCNIEDILSCPFENWCSLCVYFLIGVLSGCVLKGRGLSGIVFNFSCAIGLVRYRTVR